MDEDGCCRLRAAKKEAIERKELSDVKMQEKTITISGRAGEEASPALH
jgi:hypothetical protein